MEIFEKLRQLPLPASSQNGLMRYLLETVAGCTTTQPAWTISHRDLAERLTIPIGTLRRVITKAEALGFLRTETTATERGRGWLSYSLDMAGIEAAIAQAPSAPSATSTRTQRNQRAQPAQPARAPSATGAPNVREGVFSNPGDPNAIPPRWSAVVAALHDRGVRRARELCKQVAAAGAAPEKILEIVREYDSRRAATWPSPAGVLYNRCSAWQVPASSAWPYTPGDDKPKPDAYMIREREKYMKIQTLKQQGLSHAEAIERVAVVS